MLFKKNIENLAAFGGGRIYCKNIDFKKIVFNSKEIKGGDVFIPLKGQNHDAHKFISEAYDLGRHVLFLKKRLRIKIIFLLRIRTLF